MKSSRISLLLISLLIVGCGKQPAAPTNGTFRYQRGQVWTYHTRTGEESSRAVVLRVERDEQYGHVVHVRLEGVSFEAGGAGEVHPAVVDRLPFSVEAVDQSVIHLVSHLSEVPDYPQESQTWRQSVGGDKTRVFTVTFADQLDKIEASLIE